MNDIVAPELDAGGASVGSDTPIGGGAQFFVYISPQNDTQKWVTLWEVEFKSDTTDWKGTISSRDPVGTVLKTPNLSGLFTVTVRGEAGPRPLVQPFKPRPPSTNKIGCNSNCRSFVGIVVDANHLNATYWTTWDAVCSSGV